MNEKTNKIKMLAIFFIVLIVFSQLSLAASEQKIEKLEVKRDSKENPKSDGRQVKTKSSTNALSASMPTETPPAMLNTGAKDSFTNVLSNLDKGSFHNDLFSGSATYSYSFKVPPAPNNFIPKASINYNHHQATLRTELGNAWSLSKSYIYRNTEGTRTQTDDDTYYLVLNGATAKLVYVPNEDRYHTEQESYSHIKQDGETWTVKTKEGTIFRFGINQETSLESSLESYTSLWYLEEVEDTHSNKINYHYLKNPEQDKSMYLDKIIYSTNEIKFNYNFNAHNGFYGYIYGTKIEQTALLDNIEIKTNNVLQRKYKLDYKTIDDKKFLNKIRKIGNDGTSELPPVEFRYYENSKGWTIDNNWVLPDDANTGWDKDLGTRLLDFNSDGLTDIIKSRGNIHNIWYNTGNGFTEKKTLDNFIPGGIASGSVDKGVRFGNINEDAKIDVIKSVKGTNTVKELRINKQDHLIEEESNFPAEAAFVDIKINDCTPDPCDPGGEDHGIKCYDTSCRRKCYYENKVCSNNWVSVHESQGNGYDEMYDSENRDITNGYYVSGNDKCYKFEVDTPNSAYIGIYEDECDIGAEDDGDVVFIAGLFTNRGSNSWLQKVPAIDQYRSWYGNLEKPYNDADFEGSYLTSYEWTEESFEFGAEPRFAADNREVYCAPNYKNDYDTCIASNLYPCAFGCDNERIYAYVQSGYYYDPGHDFISTIALDDNCDRHQVWNHAGKYIKMKVYASDTSIETDWIDKVCMKTTEVRDLGVRLADVNGDGKTDIVKAPYFDNLKKIWLKTDNGWEENEEWKPEINIHFTYHYGESDGTILIDINGDNLPDFIKGNGGVRKFWINTGKNWIEDSTWKLPYEATIIKDKENQGVQITDINSDGLPDLIRAYDDIKKIWINNGRGWTEDTEWILPDKTNFRLYAWSLTDIEGDASPDIIYAAVMDSSWGKAYINKYSKQYLLKEIKNNVGGTTKIDYKKITSLDNTGNDALSDLPFNGWVVHSIEIDNGMTNDHGIKSSYTIDYSDGLFDDSNGDEKEFRGFGYVEETKIDGSKIKHWFHQDKKKKGLEYETKIMNENNKLFKKSEKHFVSQTTDPYYVVQLAASKDFTYDGVNNNPTIKQVDLDYDDFGNVVKISSLGDKSIEGDEKYSYTTYLNDVDKWIIGKPTRTYLLDSDDLTKISESFFEYDQYGGLIKSESWLNTGTNPTITYEYNSFGNLILQKDPNQNEVEYEHDSTHTYLIKTTNSLGHILEYEYDDYGNLISTTDSNENKIEYKYDVFNRKVKEIYPYDSEETPTIEYIYEFDGIAPEKTITKKKTDQDQTLDSYSYYSGLGNLIQSKIESIDSKLITSDYYYDDLLRLNSKTIPYYANNNEYTNPNKELLTTYNYDTLNRIIKVNNPDNTITKVNYNKYITTTYDENNNRHDFIKDSSGNVIEVKEYNGEEIYLTTYEYDINNNLIKITDSQDNEIKYSYDTLGRKTTLDDPDLGIWTYQYDNMGNLIKQTNNKNQEIILTYGQLNRLKTKTSEETSETYTYDQETKGTLSKIETNDITKEFEYDNRLRLIKEKKKIDNIDFITTYGYDSADRVTKKTLPNNEEIIYDYDKAGNLKSVNNVITDIQYNEINMPISKTYKNNLISQYDYDNENFRLNSIKTSDVQDLSYEYDNVGNILIIQNQIQNKKQEFEYDDLDRLTKAKKTKQDNQEIDYEITYNYDSIGNMLNLNSDVGDLEYLYENLAHTPSTIITDSDEFPCLPNWECSEWSECVGRKQSRTCVELNECERPIPKPREHQSCNNPPAIIGPPAEERTMTKKETDLITLNVNAVDEEELTYSINDENFVQDNVEKSKFTWQTDYNDAGTYYPIITVSDGLDTVDVSFRLTIENLNAAPTIEPIKDMTVNEGEKAEVIINAEDIDNDELTYSIDDDRFIQSNGQDSGFLITDDFSDNDYTNNPAWEFMYSGDDQIGGSQAEIKDGKIKITSRRTDAAFLTIGEFDWSDYSIQADIKFSNIKDYGGLVAGIGEPDENGKFTKNAYLILNGQDESFELSYRDVANSILVKDRAIQTISEDIAYTLKLELKDFEIIGYINGEEKLSIDVPTIVQGKAGLVVSSGHPSTIEFDNVYIKSKTNNNNIFTWQTTYEDGGIYDIIATVSDGTEQSTNSFLLTINNINDAPIVENIEPMTIDETDTAELIINAQDPDNDKLTYSVTITRSTIVAPKSDIFIQDPNQENKFTWKTNYEDMGTYYVYVNVDDGKSKTSKDFSLTVNDINAPPTIEPIEDITVDENELVTITINANDIDEDTMTYSVNNDNFVKTEQSNVFEWQTNHEDEGTYNIIVTVSDGTEDITEDLTITIENCKEEWSCTDWTECTDSSQTRICIDNSKCESEEDKPQEQQQCEMPCIEEWSCAEWSDCVDELQTRVCNDANKCETTEDKPITQQEC